MGTKAWPYGDDADRHDPLTALRIPVTGAHPMHRFIATFDRGSEARPTDREAAMLASYIEQYKVQHFGADGWYKRKLEEFPLDTDAVTRVFHKWGPDDWSYRVDTWKSGPFWVPASPGFRKYDEVNAWLAPLTLIQVMDRDKSMLTECPDPAWAQWKTDHPEVFGS